MSPDSRRRVLRELWVEPLSNLSNFALCFVEEKPRPDETEIVGGSEAERIPHLLPALFDRNELAVQRLVMDVGPDALAFFVQRAEVLFKRVAAKSQAAKRDQHQKVP